ncbi:hypothetical protein TWF679_009713 [Orbilia oligospora]|uniref:Uncharacterized protein n=1 Tax=Orbilia oligospora TaxID=2813651 RepID=A0A8H8VJI0_ORBOL|nr:hypothetical protein TWF679_009713 [Orbilia oligospora]
MSLLRCSEPEDEYEAPPAQGLWPSRHPQTEQQPAYPQHHGPPGRKARERAGSAIPQDAECYLIQRAQPAPAKNDSATSTRSSSKTAQRYSREENNFLIWAVGMKNIIGTHSFGRNADAWDYTAEAMYAWLLYKYPRNAILRGGRTLKEHWARTRNDTSFEASWEQDNGWGNQKGPVNDRNEMTAWYKNYPKPS